jgi:hypothetical protein
MHPRLVALALLCFPALLNAQSTHTFVSGVGDDANPGSRTAPCKTFAGVISKTAAGGTISVLDPGGFGALTITKAIIIEAETNEGGVLVSGTNGIVIAAGSNDVVTLRGLTFEGIGSGLNGVAIQQAGAVHIEDCQITGFVQNGISFTPSNAGAQLFVKDTTIKKCQGATFAGIALSPTVAATAHITNCRISACAAGITSSGKGIGIVNNTTCDGNTTAGFENSATTSKLSLVRCTSTGNGVGVQAGGPMIITECSVFNNTGAGLKTTTGGTITSFSNNTVSGNTPDGSATTTAALK